MASKGTRSEQAAREWVQWDEVNMAATPVAREESLLVTLDTFAAAWVRAAHTLGVKLRETGWN